MSTISGDSNSKSPLDAAQKIVAELKGMVSDQQLLAVRFAVETLGLQMPSGLGTPATPTNHSIQIPQTTLQTQSNSLGNSTDIKSFTASKSPKSDQQFTAVVAYYYQFESKANERKEAIDAETMKEAARQAGRPQVARWAMTLTNAKNAGYLDPAGEGKYKLSSVGENLVAITLPGNGGYSQSKANGGKTAKKKPPVKKKSKKK